MNTESKKEHRTCQNCKARFLIEDDDFTFYKKIDVPPPTFCPECRMVRRMMWRNEHHLFRVKNDFDGSDILSGIPKEANCKIFDHDLWMSDNWDPMDYGRTYDPGRSFFEQVGDLLAAVPQCAKAVMQMANSEYVNQASRCKNVYLSFDTDNGEDSAYLVNSGFIKNCFDLLGSFHDEFCYEGVVISRCNRAFYSMNCESCTDIWFCRDCQGCSNCFGCANLRDKKYHIFNAPYSKEEYVEIVKSFALGTSEGLKTSRDKALALWSRYPLKFMQGFRNAGCSGQYIRDSKAAKKCFSIGDTENIKYCQHVFYTCSDSWDYTVWGEASSRIYECVTCGMQCDSLKFCFDCWPSCQNLEYSISCRSSSDLLGCVSLKKKEYCILNRQYSKDEFHELRAKIIKDMKEKPFINAQGHSYSYGEYFPPEFSFYTYNETLAQDYLPLLTEEAVQRGFGWRYPDRKEYEITLPSEKIPQDIKDVSDSILNENIQCEQCGRAFRVIRAELEFYRSIGIAFPRRCFECRLAERFRMHSQPRFYHRTCQCTGNTLANAYITSTGVENNLRELNPLECQNITEHFHGKNPCPNEFETSYPSDSPAIVYCEQCYSAEVA